MNNFIFSVKGTDIPVFCARKNGIRNINARIINESIKLSLPPDCSESQWRGFLSRHEKWFYRKISEIREIKSKIPNFEDGALIPFRGKTYQIKISAGEKSAENVLIRDGNLEIGRTDSEKSVQDFSFKLLAWYAKQAADFALSLYDHWAKRTGLKLSGLKLGDFRSRWGMCSSGGVISLNWRLVMTPDEVFEYVLVHELCHLRIPRHGPDFWRDIAKYLPDFQDRKKWLVKNGYLPMNFLGEFKLGIMYVK